MVGRGVGTRDLQRGVSGNALSKPGARQRECNDGWRAIGDPPFSQRGYNQPIGKRG
jgi:hypothetical protein